MGRHKKKGTPRLFKTKRSAKAGGWKVRRQVRYKRVGKVKKVRHHKKK